MLLGLSLHGILLGDEERSIGWLSEICSEDFMASTQMGEVEASLSVCHLQSTMGPDTSLYVVVYYAREFSTYVERILPNACSPVMGRDGDEVFILYTSGVNTTCATIYSIKSGVVRFRSTETIAWNDGGIFRRGKSFHRYESILWKRWGLAEKKN